MPKKKLEAPKTQLRIEAERAIDKQKNKTQALKNVDTQRLIQELEVHQIELEMQNRELMVTRSAIEETLRQYQELYDFAPAGYFSLSHIGTILKTNLTGAKMLGTERKQLEKQRFGIFVAAASRETFATFLDDVFLKNSGPQTCEVELLSGGGAPLWVQVKASTENWEDCSAVMVDITARKNFEQEILRLNASLEQRVEERTRELTRANRIKDEFLAMMSHELRTPLAGILGFSEILLDGTRGPLNEKQMVGVQVIQSSGTHLLNLINDILDVTKIESGNFELYPESVDVLEISEASLALIQQLAHKKSIAVGFSTLPFARINADPQRLKQILINLLSNAIKFTPSQGSVKLEITPEAAAGRMRFSITDTGIGISPEDLPKLFMPFVQLDSKLSRQFNGTGLGLSLVKKLVEMHGGNVDVQSEVGCGSCFSFSLPWNPTLDMAHALQETGAPSPQPAAPNPENKPSPSGARILLADDDEGNAILVHDYLEDFGYRVTVAVDGSQVMSMVEQVPPELIVMDIQMPYASGIELTQRLRADPRFASIPIIALSAFAMPGDEEHFLEAGMNCYLSKPFVMKELRELIEKLLK